MEGSSLVYCGLGVFINPLTAEKFEKTADNQYIQIDDEKSSVECRFVKKYAEQYNNGTLEDRAI